MGFFRWMKRKDKAVWRDNSGNIFCPGDSCPKVCDETCPVFINTEATTCMMLGKYDKAITLYEKAIAIEPDFYDAWNNMGGGYGGLGKYQKAYDCYLKAHQCNAAKPNPVYGLMMTTRDLGRYEECLSWCAEYKKLSKDGREKDIIEVVKRRLNN